MASLRWTPHPDAVIVTMRNNKDNIRVLLSSYYTTIIGWGVLLRYPSCYTNYFSHGCILNSAAAGKDDCRGPN